MRSVCAVVVTYNPDLPTLENAILATSNQVDKVYVVDNASDFYLVDFLSRFERVEGVFLEYNFGIASGFNRGIQLARESGYSYLLLLDQDSVPPADMVHRYSIALARLRLEGQPVAAVGPRYRDPRSQQVSSFVLFKWFHNGYISGHDGSLLVPTDFLISSGSFYPLEVFEKIGLFHDEFFIDHVDTEWCHRAAKFGYKLFGVPDVIMNHSLGEGRVRLWFLRWRTQPIHKPFRLYYIVRNSLLMYQMSHIPFRWISGDVFRLVRLMIIYAVFCPQRIEALGWFFAGLRDGVRDVTGPAKLA